MTDESLFYVYFISHKSPRMQILLMLWKRVISIFLSALSPFLPPYLSLFLYFSFILSFLPVFFFFSFFLSLSFFLPSFASFLSFLPLPYLLYLPPFLLSFLSPSCILSLPSFLKSHQTLSIVLLSDKIVWYSFYHNSNHNKHLPDTKVHMCVCVCMYMWYIGR